MKDKRFLIEVPNMNSRLGAAHLAVKQPSIAEGRYITCCIDTFSGEPTLTPYGRKRSAVCEGGWTGCHGISELRNNGDYNSFQCDNCFKLRKIEVKHCALCGLGYKEGFGHNPLPLMLDTEKNKVCSVCNLFIEWLRVGFVKGTNES